MEKIILEKLKNLVNSLFQPNDSPGSRLLERTLLVILYLFGVVLWVRFLNYGNIPNDRLDWADITFPRLHVIQQAVQQAKLPLYVAEESGLKGVTNLFLSIPDQILSPDVFLLGFLSIEQFIIIHILIFYSLGYWGLILFKGKYKLSFFAFFPLFLLFNFNGHIVSHLSVGHLTWASYFLYSFFFLLIFEIFDDQLLSWKWIARMSFLQFFIFLSGGYHQFVWALMILFVLFLFVKNNKITIFYSIISSICANFFRILPAALLTENLDMGFLAGFPTTEKIIESLYKMSSIENMLFFDKTKVDILGWELYFYLGLVGLVYILYFSITFFRDNKDQEILKLVIPSFILLFLASGNFYKFFFETGIPLLSGERISSRFLIMTILIMLFVTSLQIQKIFKRKIGYINSGIALGSIMISNDLLQNLFEWGISNVVEYYPIGIYTPLSLGEGNDPLYIGLLITGGVLSIISIIFFILKLMEVRK